MLFNSIEFALFLPLVFALYWLIPARKIHLQNTLLLISSLVFYGWWDWRFLFLLILSASVDYFIGFRLSKTTESRKRKVLLALSLIVNLGTLGFFKYYNFFLDSFVEAFTFMGNPLQVSRLDIVLPVGISFYTFQTLSYTLDIYNRKLAPTRNPVGYFAYVCFFPQLVAGPIERATNLLPQFFELRRFEYKAAVDGSRQMLWGFFKKIVIADNCAPIVDQVFSSYHDYSGSTLLLAAVLFAFQIYCDFSGYSDIAIGVSRWFGFNLMRNFAYPYFSRDIAEFWRRWHISLSTWFRDYLYIPLGGSQMGRLINVRNILIIFIVSGFWHGANWTFLAWGALNGLYFIPLFLAGKNRRNLEFAAGKWGFPSLTELKGIFITFSLTVLAWIFFRSATISDAFLYIFQIFNPSFFNPPELRPWLILGMIICMIVVEWRGRFLHHPLALYEGAALSVRWTIYVVISFIILFNIKVHDPNSFIYFQF